MMIKDQNLIIQEKNIIIGFFMTITWRLAVFSKVDIHWSKIIQSKYWRTIVHLAESFQKLVHAARRALRLFSFPLFTL